jgi:hypothetical protein
VRCSHGWSGEESFTRLLLMVYGLDIVAMYRFCGVLSVVLFASHPDHTA